MEEMKLLMDDIMKERKRLDEFSKCGNELIKKHNLLADDFVKLQQKHNKLCKSTALLCVVCLGLDALIFLNAIEISKLKEKLNKKEEG